MASNTATPRPTDTTDGDAATHFATTHGNGSGLENSPLGRLPPELRNEIFSMAMTYSHSIESDRKSFFNNFGFNKTTPTCPEISCALNIMATCKQIRSETKNLFFSLNDIRVRRSILYNSVKQVERIIPLLRRLPRSLGLDSGRVVLPVLSGAYHYSEDAELDSRWDEGGLKHLFLTTSQAIRPFQLFIDLDVAFHSWCASGDIGRAVCSQDTPVTTRDCSRFHLDLQVGVGPTAGLSQIDKVIDDKLESLRQHRLHRLCPVRAMLRQFESRLEAMRKHIRLINDFVSEFPDAVTTESDA
jgi:hypothetical protein